MRAKNPRMETGWSHAKAAGISSGAEKKRFNASKRRLKRKISTNTAVQGGKTCIMPPGAIYSAAKHKFSAKRSLPVLPWLSVSEIALLSYNNFTKDAVANVDRDFFFTHQSQVSPSTYELIFITALQQFSLPLGRFTPRSTVFRKAPGKSVVADQPWLKRQGLLICLGMELKDPIGWELFYGTGVSTHVVQRVKKWDSPKKSKGG